MAILAPAVGALATRQAIICKDSCGDLPAPGGEIEGTFYEFGAAGAAQPVERDHDRRSCTAMVSLRSLPLMEPFVLHRTTSSARLPMPCYDSLRRDYGCKAAR